MTELNTKVYVSNEIIDQLIKWCSKQAVGAAMGQILSPEAGDNMLSVLIELKSKRRLFDQFKEMLE